MALGAHMISNFYPTYDRMKQSIKAVAAVAFAAFVLTGCVTQDPRLTETLKGVQVAAVQVEATPDVATGAPMLNNMTPQQQVALVVSSLQNVATRELKGYPGGKKPVRLVITLQSADLASMQGRVLLSSDSYISGTVRLEDITTGQLVAQNPQIRGENTAVKGGDLGGMAIALAVNAMMTKSQDQLAEKLAIDFTKNIKTWLTPKK